MDFFAVFVRDGCVVCGAGVGAEDYAVFVDEAYDCGACFGGEGDDGFVGIFVASGRFLELGFDERVAVHIFEVEAVAWGRGVEADVGVGEF